MSEIAGFLELIGFDIFLLGIVTLLFIVALCAGWSFPGAGLSAAHKAARKFLINISMLWFRVDKPKEPASDEKNETPNAEKKSPNDPKEPLIPGFKRSTLVLIGAACLGMFMNHLADELLEVIPAYSPTRIEHGFLEYLGTEDEIKHYTTTNLLRDLPAQQGLVFGTHDSKQFFQRAYVTMLASGKPNVTSMLRFEFLVLRLLRVLFVCSGALALVVLGRFIYALHQWEEGKLEGYKKKPESGIIEKRALVVACLFALAFACLCLSGEQQSRYCKKLCHAYLALPANDREAYSLEPLLAFAHPIGAPVPLAAAEFVNTSADGEIKMFELSGATAARGELIVVDNERGMLGTNNAGLVDQAKEAVFRVRLEEGQKPKIERCWSEAFAKLRVPYDDLEGITSGETNVYFIGSHSVDKSGFFRADRHVLLRLALGTNGALGRAGLSVESFTNLTAAIRECGAALALETVVVTNKNRSQTMEVTKDLNIEGLAIVPKDDGLFIGLRGPLSGEVNSQGQSKALLLRLENPDELFQASGARPKLSLFATLDLGGQGISSLEYDPVSDSMLIGSSPAKEDGAMASHLWQWKFRTKNAKPGKLMTFVGRKLEGVARIPKGQPYGGNLLLTFDEEDSTGNSRQFGRIEVVRWKEK
jgi:hypothetical protein